MKDVRVLVRFCWSEELLFWFDIVRMVVRVCVMKIKYGRNWVFCVIVLVLCCVLVVVGVFDDGVVL